MKKVLVLSPNFEPATQLAHPYFVDFANKLEDRYDVITLFNEDDNKRKVWDIINTEKPQSLFMIGHGDTNVTTGYNYDILFIVGDAPDMSSFKVSVWLSCLMGRELLPWLVKERGLKSGIGWKEEYGFFANLTDEFIGTIEEAFYKLHIIDGVYTMQDVYDYIYRRYTELIKVWERTDPEVADWLRWDRDNMVLHGDKNAWIYKEPVIEHQVLEADATYKVLGDKVRLHIFGTVSTKEDKKPLKNVTVLVTVNDVQKSTTTDSSGEFSIDVEVPLESKYEVHIKTADIVTEKPDKVFVIKGTETKIEVSIKIETTIVAWVEEIKRQELKLPNSRYLVRIGFKILDENGNEIVPTRQELSCKIQDIDGYNDCDILYDEEKGYFIAQNYSLYYPTIRIKDLEYSAIIKYTPKDEKYMPSEEKLSIKLKENITNPVIIALIILAVILGLINIP